MNIMTFAMQKHVLPKEKNMNPNIEKTNCLKRFLKIETDTKKDVLLNDEKRIENQKQEYFHGSAYMSSPKASEVPLPPDDFFL